MKQNHEREHSKNLRAGKVATLILISITILWTGPGPASGQIPGTKRWDIAAPLHVFSSAAIGADGTVYIGAGTDDDPSFSTGLLYSIKPDGTTNWVLNLPNHVRSSPAIGPDGRVYVGCMNGELKIVQPDGKYSVVRLGGEIPGSAAISVDGTIYIGSFSNYCSRLYALSPDGAVRWVFKMARVQNSLPEQFSSPAIGPDGMIYVGSTDANLYAITPEGKTNWVFPLVTSTNQSLTSAAPTYASPSVGPDGTIYIGADNGVLYAIAPNGNEKWEFQTAGIIESSAAIAADGTIYVGSLGGVFYAITPAGIEKWSYPTGPVSDSPALASDGTIYVANWSTQQLFAFNSSGSIVWTLSTASGTADFLFSSPTLGADGTIYFGSGKRIFAVYGSAGIMQSTWPMFRANPPHTARSVQRGIANHVALTENQCLIDLLVEPGRMYRVDWSTNLVNWTVLTNVVSGTCNSQIFDRTDGLTHRYYRLSTPLKSLP